MDKQKIKDQLNEIKTELAYMRGMLQNVSNQMQELRENSRVSSNQDKKLPVRELYEHPWYKYKREQLIFSGDYTKSNTKTQISVE
jgi:hypothetical protein